MNIQFEKSPIDIILFMFWTIILIPLVLFNISDILRITLGIPFLLFIPGYILIFILFPRKKEYKSIQGVERIGLSLGFSIVLDSLVGLLLNYTPWGIRLESIFFTIFVLTEIFGVVALYRWKTTSKEQRFTIALQTSNTKPVKKINVLLSVILAFSIIAATISIIYIIGAPVTGESFTEFYILSSNQDETLFPQDILAGQDINFTLGLINHEYTTMDYTIEIWLVDESIQYNRTTKENMTIYNHAWFMDKMDIRLDHTEITNNKNQTKKWEYTYNFNINQIGLFKLTFLLFTTPSENFDPNYDYKETIESRINYAYRELHLWLYVG